LKSITAPIFQERKQTQITSSKLREIICDDWLSSTDTFKYTPEYVQYYIESKMKSEVKDKEVIVSEATLKIWLNEAIKHKKSENFLEIFIASFEKDHQKTVKSLYDVGKACYQVAARVSEEDPAFIQNLQRGKELFEIYHDLVEKNVDVRPPANDRHLWYLMKLDELPMGASASSWGDQWDTWKKTYNIKDPES